MSDTNPNVEAFKVHARVQLKRLMQRYIDKENTPAVRASIMEMVEAKLNDLVKEHFSIGDDVVEIEGSHNPEEMVIKIKLPILEAFDIEECLRLAQEDEDDEGDDEDDPAEDWKKGGDDASSMDAE